MFRLPPRASLRFVAGTVALSLVLIAVGAALPPGFNPFRAGQASAAQVTIDATASATTARFRNSQPRVVFTTDQIGYVFYTDSTNVCVYSKTTDGGATWGAAVTINSTTGCIDSSVWYDRWTPGDNSGNYIYVLSFDANDIWYNRIDTANSDTRESGATSVAVTISPGPVKTNTFTNALDRPALTKGTDDILYLAMTDNGTGGDESYILSCSASCATVSNWADVGTYPGTSATSDQYQLMPLASGDILVIRLEKATPTYMSRVWDGAAWDGAWTNFGSFTGTVNGNYIATQGSTVNRTTNDIYFTYTNDTGALGTNDDIMTAIYSGGAWTNKTNVVTNSVCSSSGNCGITSTKTAINENNGDVYVTYSARVTPATATTANTYWKKSTDGMTTWGTEQGPMNTATSDTYGPMVNIMSDERFFVAWHTFSADNVVGDTMADLVAPTVEVSGYRWYAYDSTLTPATPLAAANTTVLPLPVGTPFRMRMLIHIGGDGLQAGADMNLQFAASNGTCDTAHSGETFANVSTTTVVGFYDVPSRADGAAITTSGNDPAHSGHTIVAQNFQDSGSFATSVDIPGGQDGLWDFSLIDNTHTTGQNYCFRITRVGGLTVSTPLFVPEFLQPSLNDSMRHGNFFNGSAEQSNTW